MSKMLSALMLLGILGAAGQASAQGGADDAGIWNGGDFWRFDRTFRLSLDGLVTGSSGTIGVNERYTKTVNAGAPIINTANSLGAANDVYVRSRSNTTVTGNGLWFIPAVSTAPPADAFAEFDFLAGTSTIGYDWRRVSDMAEVRENFTVSGTIRARISAFAYGGTYTDEINLSASIVANIDNGPALEYGDWPVEVVGEVWEMQPQRALVGNAVLQVELISIVGGIVTIPASTITQPINEGGGDTFRHTSLAVGNLNVGLLGGGTFSGPAGEIDAVGGFTGDHIFWSATAKEWIDNSFGVSALTSGLLQGFRTSVSGSLAGTDYSVTADSNATGIVISPARPRWGQAFNVSGNKSGGGFVGTLLRTGEAVAAGGGGTFSLDFTAPVVDDSSPMVGATNIDYGSFGILFTSAGTPVELASVRLDKPFLQVQSTNIVVSEADPTATITLELVGLNGAVGNNGIIPLTYDFTTADGTAVAGTDYTATSGAGVAFTRNGGTAEIIVPILDDIVCGPTVDFTVSITAVNSYADLGGQLTTTVSITDDEGPCVGVPTPTPPPAPTPSPNATATPSPNATATPSPPATATPPPAPTPSPNATATPAAPTPTAAACCPGDADNSGGFVDAGDYIAVQSFFGQDNGVGGPGDADCSGGFVDAGDYIGVQANFGIDCG